MLCCYSACTVDVCTSASPIEHARCTHSLNNSKKQWQQTLANACAVIHSHSFGSKERSVRMGRRSTGGICNWVAGLPCWPFSFKQPTLADTKICDPQLASHTMSHCLMPAACATTLCETVHSSTLPTNRFLAALCSHMPQYYSIQQQMVVPRQKYYLEPSVTTHPSFAQTALVCMALHTAILPARRGNPGCRQTPRSLETPPSTPRYDKCRDHGAPLHALGTRTAGCCCVMQWMLPPPSSTSRVGTETTLRSGKASCSTLCALRAAPPAAGTRARPCNAARRAARAPSAAVGTHARPHGCNPAAPAQALASAPYNRARQGPLHARGRARTARRPPRPRRRTRA